MHLRLVDRVIRETSSAWRVNLRDLAAVRAAMSPAGRSALTRAWRPGAVGSGR